MFLPWISKPRGMGVIFRENLDGQDRAGARIPLLSAHISFGAAEAGKTARNTCAAGIVL